MTQVYREDGRVVPVTVLEIGPCRVVHVKTHDSDRYDAVQLGFGARKRKRVAKPQQGHFRRANVEPPAFLAEVPMPDAGPPDLGATLTVAEFEGVFEVDVSGTSKGRGFAGVMKRWGFAGGPASHGCSKRHRAPGSIGCAATPDKAIVKGKKMAGHMGHRRRTVRNLEVVSFDEGNSLLLVKGAVPGPNGGFVTVRESKVRRRKGK